MAEFSQLLVSGLALGVIYGLVALGFVIIYRASQVFNFAHGEFLTLGAVVMVFASSPALDVEANPFALGSNSVDGWGLPWGAALILAMSVTGIVAMLVERFVLRPLVGRPVFVTIIVTLFIGAILRVCIILIFGNDTLPILTPWEPLGTVQVGGAMLDHSSIASLIAGLIAFMGFGYLLQKTRFGIQMRATSSDQEAALGVGIPVGKVLAITWFLAGAMAAMAGVFLGIRDYSVDLNLGYIALRAFPAVIVGGLDSVMGAIVAGLLLGTLEVMTAGYINALLGPWGKNLHTVMPYLAMIIVLMIRPQGLFGSEKVERV